MGLDPRGIATDPDRRRVEKTGDLEARVAALERSPVVQSGAGAPTSAPRDGTLYVDTTAHRLYVRDSGTWRYVITT
jgi:hypothetical protein